MLKIKNIILTVFALFLVGCGAAVDETAYKEAIEAGLNYFAVEEYNKAEVQFEQALEEKENDEQAEAFLTQTITYQEAVHLFEEENFDESIVQAQMVIDVPNGATSISNKAKELIDEITDTQEKIALEAAEAEREIKKVEEEEEEIKDPSNEETIYDYSDFVGYYLHFDPNNPAHSDMMTGVAYDQIIVAWWGSEANTYEVLNSSINGNALTIDYYMPDLYMEGEGTNGTMELTLDEVDGQRIIRSNFEPNLEFYKVPYEEVQSYGYSLIDFVN